MIAKAYQLPPAQASSLFGRLAVASAGERLVNVLKALVNLRPQSLGDLIEALVRQSFASKAPFEECPQWNAQVAMSASLCQSAAIILQLPPSLSRRRAHSAERCRQQHQSCSFAPVLEAHRAIVRHLAVDHDLEGMRQRQPVDPPTAARAPTPRPPGHRAATPGGFTPLPPNSQRPVCPGQAGRHSR